MEWIRNDQTIILKLVGRLDANTATEVVDGAQNEHFKHMEIYMEELEYISSAGLRALLICKKAVDACGGTLIVKNPQPAVMDIMALSGFKKMLDIRTEE
ncbi:MAG: STAS domain-containing protein [Christensenella sp.]